MKQMKKGIVSSAVPAETPDPADVEDTTEAPETGAPDAEDKAEPETSEAGESPDANDETDQDSPQDKSVEDQVRLAAYKLMYSETGFPMMLQKFAAGKADIGQAIGHTLAMLLLSIQNSARAKGNEIKPEIIMDVGLDILDDMIKIAVASSMVKPEFEEKAQARALFVAFKAYGDAEIKAGHITPQSMQEAQQELSGVGIDPAQAAQAVGAPQPITPAPQTAAPPSGIVNQSAGA